MLKKETKQVSYFDEVLERIVPQNHIYRKLKTLIDFEELLKPYEKLYSKMGCPSEPLTRGFKGLLLQFWNDLSDRELESHLSDSNSAKWFCNYHLEENTPQNSYFCKLRSRIGAKNLAKIFNTITQAIEEAGYVGKTFSFVDASQMISKVNVWEARDKALEDQENSERGDDDQPKMNNKNVGDYSSDPDARFGCKGRDKFWLGYKRHHRVDMKQGIITKVAVTSADVTDAQAFIDEGLCPEEEMVFLDKGYDCNDVDEYIEDQRCANATIRKKNRKCKNRELDRWRSSIRMPFENTFSKMQKRCRYRTRPKVTMQALLEATVHNLKRLIRIDAPALQF